MIGCSDSGKINQETGRCPEIPLHRAEDCPREEGAEPGGVRGLPGEVGITSGGRRGRALLVQPRNWATQAGAPQGCFKWDWDLVSELDEGLYAIGKSVLPSKMTLTDWKSKNRLLSRGNVHGRSCESKERKCKVVTKMPHLGHLGRYNT